MAEAPHSVQLANLNPTRIFKKSAIDYGVDSHTVNPLIKCKRTRIHFLGHESSYVTIVSFFSPLNLGYNSCFALNSLLNMKASQLAEYFTFVFSSVPVIAYRKSTNPNTVTIQYNNASFFNTPSGSAFNGAPATLNNVYGGAGTQRAVIDSFKLIFTEYFKTVLLPFSNIYLVDTIFAIDIFDYSVSRIPFPKTRENVASQPAFNNAFGAALTRHFVGYNISYTGAAVPVTYPCATVDVSVRAIPRQLSCVTALNESLTNSFIGFLTEMFFVSSNRIIHFRNKPDSTVIAIYADELRNRRLLSESDYTHIDALVKAGLVRVKTVSPNQSISYLPKSQTNAHWICVPPGTTVKLSTIFSRDYSGFMSLFKSAVKNQTLRQELTDIGYMLFQKLEPTYNLFPE